MRILFFGLGSIGQRHLDNLQAILSERHLEATIEAFRSYPVKETDGHFTKVKMLYHPDEIVGDYDIVFVTNPTNQHYSTLIQMFDRAKYFFIEKPVFESVKSIEKIITKNEQCYVACPLRHKLIYKKLYELVNANSVHSVRVIASSYLPSWRTSDYRNSYSAQSSQGGGVELDCIHELDYIIDLFGLPNQSYSTIKKVSNLEISSNDHASYLLDYDDKVVELHLDYYGKYNRRNIELITNKGLIEVDFIKNTISQDGNVIERLPEERNDFYINEMNYFIDLTLQGTVNINTLKQSLETLKIAIGEA